MDPILTSLVQHESLRFSQIDPTTDSESPQARRSCLSGFSILTNRARFPSGYKCFHVLDRSSAAEDVKPPRSTISVTNSTNRDSPGSNSSMTAYVARNRLGFRMFLYIELHRSNQAACSRAY